jgi:hypothetical protein
MEQLCSVLCICFVCRDIMEKTGTRINFRDELDTDLFRVACIK